MRAHIDDVLALVALLSVWAGTARQLANSDAVDIACSACHINRFFRYIIGAAPSSIDHKHPGFSVRLLRSY